MVFSSTLFVFFFLPITLLGYYLIKESYRNYWLLFVSLVFFGWSQPNYLWIIVLNIVINYVCAMLISQMPQIRKYIVVTAVLVNIAILFYFKYFNFTIETINNLANCNISIKDIVLPIGISFFTFQGMSYVIDVYRGDVPVQKNIFKVGLYIVLFPQLIAGPIVRYRDIAYEIDHRKNTLDDFCSGIERFIIGLGKKAIIANTMAATADAIWNTDITKNTWIIAWLGSIAYTLQIYFDFSGYSDMAIGLGRMFGFHFNENFNLPYISKNITEFWRRWHISLSSWFRDYVYIPLGGNRKHVYLNLAIVFLLTGIWHGASWHYILWGIWNGFFILIERAIKMRKMKNNKELQQHTKQSVGKSIISSIYTLFVINMGWVLFRADTLGDALKYAAIMLGRITPEHVGFSVFWYLDRWTMTIMGIAFLFSSSIPTKIATAFRNAVAEKVYVVCKYVLLIGLLYLCMLRIVSGTYNPFIYFQF